jgi:hypothetical protein
MLACAAVAGTKRTPKRVALGAASLSSSTHFALIPSAMFDSPVMLPPGRGRLATNPLPTGSPTWAMTMGIVWVARLSATTAGLPWATMTSSRSRTSSAASSE